MTEWHKKKQGKTMNKAKLTEQSTACTYKPINILTMRGEYPWLLLTMSKSGRLGHFLALWIKLRQR